MAKEHIESKYIPQLTEVEKKVILNLAELGPLCGYDFHLGSRRERGPRKAIMSSGYWQKAETKLGPKGLNLIQLVQLVGRPKEGSPRRRRKPYWLTWEGIRVSLLEGASPKTLFQYSQRYLSKEENADYISCILELSEIASMRKFLTFLLGSEKNIELSDFSHFGNIDARSPETKRIIKVFKKYPRVFKVVRQGVDESKRRIQDFDEVLSDE